LKNRNAHARSKRSVRRERRRIMMECRDRWWCVCAWVGGLTDHLLSRVALSRGSNTRSTRSKFWTAAVHGFYTPGPNPQIPQTSPIALLKPTFCKKDNLEMYYILDTGTQKRSEIVPVAPSVEPITTYNTVAVYNFFDLVQSCGAVGLGLAGNHAKSL